MISVKEQEVYEQLMRRCIELAVIARERGESPVGCVIVREGKIIAEGIEGGKAQKDITLHAEIEAIRSLAKVQDSKDFSDCILVTTHEPCIMCSYVIRHYGIGTVVFGLATGEIGGYSSALPVLLDKTVLKWNTPPKIFKNILEKQCRDLHR